MESEEQFPEIRKSLDRFRRHMPHWQSGGSTLFVEWNVLPGQRLTEPERAIVMDCIRKFDRDRYVVFAGVVMPDHVHLLIHPLEERDGVWWNLGKILKGMKGVSARLVNQLRGTTGSLWKDERYDRIVRSTSDFKEKWYYIWNNPVKAGLVERAEDWDALYVAGSPDGWLPG